ncbi:hypothetical protein GWK47_021142 [Chionoecetes opilio]|uniref:Secreted protein n=1 Tax=Chionoecetes opilio TaxID=41210 RepID=A0A8J4XPN0_CHIOP|nr:hypothetical protein GWK47_021142 [Chionoecetes opilio]
MGGLARILVVVVVVVALATRPSLQQFGAELDGLAQRCRDNVGEQAAVDFINAPYQLMTCTKYEAMYAEIQSSLRENNLKRGLQSVCKRKDELQTCTDQWYQTVKRCLIGEEKKVSAIFYGLIKPMMDFICEHVDDIVAMRMRQFSPERAKAVLSPARTIPACSSPFQPGLARLAKTASGPA